MAFQRRRIGLHHQRAYRTLIGRGCQLLHPQLKNVSFAYAEQAQLRFEQRVSSLPNTRVAVGMGIGDSIWSALGRDESDSPDAALGRVRTAMLLLVEKYGGEDHFRLDMKINFAHEISELWYLRPEVMQVVAAAQGEQVAQECMADITALFKKYHLGGTPSRFGKL